MSAHANVRFATAMAEAVAAAAPGEPGEPTPDAQYAAFVTSTLRHLERGMRLDNTTKKQRVSTTFQNAELLIEDSKKSAARRVVEGRFALGGDDASYLQSGLSTLWTTAAGVGEEELDYDGDDKKTREEEYGSMKDEALAPVGLYAPDAIEGIRDGLIRAMKRRGQTILRDAPKSLAVVASAVRVLAKVPGFEEVLLLSDGEDEPTSPTMPKSWDEVDSGSSSSSSSSAEDMLRRLEARDGRPEDYERMVTILNKLLKLVRSGGKRFDLSNKILEAIKDQRNEMEETERARSEALRQLDDKKAELVESVLDRARLANRLKFANAAFEQTQAELEETKRDMEDRIGDLEVQIKEREDSRKKIALALLAQTNQLEETKLQLGEAEKEITRLEAARDAVKKSLKDEIDEGVKSEALLRTQIERKEAELAENKKELAVVSQILMFSDAAFDETQARLEKKQLEIDTCKEAIARLKTQRSALEESLKKEQLDSEKTQANLTAQIEERTRERDKAKGKIERLEKELEKTKASLKNKETDFKKVNAKLNQARGKIKALEEQLVATEQARDEAAEKAQQCEERLRTAQEEFAKMQATHQEANKELQRTLAAAKKLHEQAMLNAEARVEQCNEETARLLQKLEDFTVNAAKSDERASVFKAEMEVIQKELKNTELELQQAIERRDAGSGDDDDGPDGDSSTDDPPEEQVEALKAKLAELNRLKEQTAVVLAKATKPKTGRRWMFPPTTRRGLRVSWDQECVFFRHRVCERHRQIQGRHLAEGRPAGVEVYPAGLCAPVQGSREGH